MAPPKGNATPEDPLYCIHLFISGIDLAASQIGVAVVRTPIIACCVKNQATSFILKTKIRNPKNDATIAKIAGGTIRFQNSTIFFSPL
jgi:hypothetical protein